jgi:hypothetical protein
MAMEAKVEGVLQFRQSLLADAEAIKSEIDRLKARADGLTRKAEWMRWYVQHAMEQTGIGKISTLTFSATIAKSPPRVELADGAEIPADYRREKTTVDLDKTKALNDFKAGVTLPSGLSVVQGQYLKVS